MKPKSNPVMRQTLVMLERLQRKEKLAIWGAAVDALREGSSKKVEVNVGHLAKITAEKSAVFVAGKVLGTGVLDKAITVGAFSYSASARKKIESAGGAALGIKEFVGMYPKGSGVTLVS